MDTKQFTIAAVAGAVALFVLGYLIHGLLLPDYTGTTGSATGVRREEPALWAIGLGQLMYGLLLASVLSRWSSELTTMRGLVGGALLGLLFGLGVNLEIFGATRIHSFFGAIVEAVLFMVRTTVGGAVVAIVLARKPVPKLEEGLFG